MGYSPPEFQGWMDSRELQWLYDRAAESESVVEIGSWKGRSTHALLSGCKGPVFAVDHFKGNPDELQGAHREAIGGNIFSQFWQHVGHFENLVVMRMESTKASKFFAPRSIDMIFIDGCHTAEAFEADLTAWGPVCRTILCGHDVSYNSIKEVFTKMKVSYCAVDVGSLWRAELWAV
jgi:hypothetical protein